MAMNSNTGVTYRSRRDGTLRLVISFGYVGRDGSRRRFRRDARAPSREGARVEAKRLMTIAATTGSALGSARAPTFLDFVRGPFERDHLPRFKPSTVRRYRDLLRQRLIPHFGHVRMDGVMRHVPSFVGGLARDKIQAKGPVTLLRTVLRAAVEQGVLASVPVLPKVRPAEKVRAAPSEEECLRLLEAASGYLRPAIALAILAGLRSGEVRALQAKDVDLAHDGITVRWTMSDVEVTPPKSGRQRLVPINGRLREILIPALQRLRPHDRVVVSRRGNVLSHQALLTRLNALETRLGMRQWNFHALRHAFATRLGQRGASVESIRCLLGHATLQQTLDYLHANDRELTAAVGKLDGTDAALGLSARASTAGPRSWSPRRARGPRLGRVSTSTRPLRSRSRT